MSGNELSRVAREDQTMTLDELAQMEFAVQEALWANYESAPQDLKDCGYLQQPDERLTLEQHKSRIVSAARRQVYFRIPDASYKSFKRRG